MRLEGCEAGVKVCHNGGINMWSPDTHRDLGSLRESNWTASFCGTELRPATRRRGHVVLAQVTVRTLTLIVYIKLKTAIRSVLADWA